jgi:hypothetical protein
MNTETTQSAHPLDHQVAKFKDSTAARRIGNAAVFSTPTASASPDTLVYVPTLEGVDIDATHPVEARANAVFGAICELIGECNSIANDKRRSQFSIDEGQLKASTEKTKAVVRIMDEMGDYERTTERNASEFYAAIPLDPTHAAEAVLDADIRQRTAILPRAELAKLLRGNHRATLAILRDPLAVRDARYECAL